MTLKRWSDLPKELQKEEIREYYNILWSKRGQLFIKRLMDIIGALIGTIVLLPFMIIIGIVIKLESKGPAIFKQVRVTQYNKKFNIYKFRTMVVDAEKLGTQVTSKNDCRITGVGKVIRKCRLDEIPQIINILKGDLSFVGTRPEVPKYVDEYSTEMLATLFLPAGVTSRASIEFKDEEKILDGCANVDKVYIEEVLPLKMKYNLQYIKDFNIKGDLITIIDTVKAVFL